MGTRANIQIKDKEQTIHLYHGHDGDSLENLFKDYFSLKMFKETDYTERHFAKSDWAEDVATGLIKLQDWQFELTTSIHGDEEYFYEIDCVNKTVKEQDLGLILEYGEQKAKNKRRI